MKFLEYFESVLYKKGLHAKYRHYKELREAHKAEYNLHKTGNPKKRKRNDPVRNMDYILNMSLGSGKPQPEAHKGSKQPTGSHTKIEA